MKNSKKYTQLIDSGVKILNPESVFIDPEVNVDRISGKNVIIYPGVRIFGEETLICDGVELGKEVPVTIENCYIGPGTSLKGGYFQKACFLGKNQFGSGAHVREGTILEEEASAAHCVGLKQTILFPFVTLGSLINFCDCFMAGGTDRKNHSEVGSSYIHFNYTPNQDKATPSMMGNVHQGVLLNQNPIFLGGQGGLVGPCKIGFGCLTAAGSIIRKDELKPDRLLLGSSLKEASISRGASVYRNIPQIYNNNIEYIAALISLLNWYKEVRFLFVDGYFSKQLFVGMVITLEAAIDERIKRLHDFVGNLKKEKLENQENIIDAFPEKLQFLTEQKTVNFSDSIPKIEVDNNNYIDFIKSLKPEIGLTLSKWLYNIECKIFEKSKI